MNTVDTSVQSVPKYMTPPKFASYGSNSEMTPMLKKCSRISCRVIRQVPQGSLMNSRADFSMTTAMSVKERTETRHEV